MLKIGIVIDDWKLSIFERLLAQSGYQFRNAGLFTPGTLTLQVVTNNVEALGIVVKAANTEAAMTGVLQ